MKWLSERFIQKAQDSSLAGEIPKEKIPEFLRLAATNRDGALRLLTNQNEVIEVTECQLPVYMRKSRAYLQKNAPPEYRDSIASILTASSASSRVSSVFSDRSRASIASTNTNASVFSPEPPVESTKKSAVIPKSWERTPGKPHLCPTCGKGFKYPWDRAKHIRNFCERHTTEFGCQYCEKTSEEQTSIEDHCRLMHPDHTVSVRVVPSPIKVAYGCSFCENASTNLEMYIKCMEADEKRDPTLLPIPSRRLSALLGRSEGIQRALEQACDSHGLHPNAWKDFSWTDEICDEYSRKLEYDIASAGVNIQQLVEELLTTATFESSDDPAPPLNHATPAVGHATSMHNIHVPNPPPVNHLLGQVYNQNFAESPGFHNAPPAYPKTLYGELPYVPNPKNMTAADAEMYQALTFSALEAAAQQSRQQSPRMMMPPAHPIQKRHPSLDSATHPESSFRAKRHPTATKLVLREGKSDRPDSMALPAAPSPLPLPTPVIGMEEPFHSVPTQKGDGATGEPDPVSDLIDDYGYNRDSVAFDEYGLGNAGTSIVYGGQQEYWAQQGYMNQEQYGYQQAYGSQQGEWNQQQYGNQQHWSN